MSNDKKTLRKKRKNFKDKSLKKLSKKKSSKKKHSKKKFSKKKLSKKKHDGGSVELGRAPSSRRAPEAEEETAGQDVLGKHIKSGLNRRPTAALDLEELEERKEVIKAEIDEIERSLLEVSEENQKNDLLQELNKYLQELNQIEIQLTFLDNLHAELTNTPTPSSHDRLSTPPPVPGTDPEPAAEGFAPPDSSSESTAERNFSVNKELEENWQNFFKKNDIELDLNYREKSNSSISYDINQLLF